MAPRNGASEEVFVQAVAIVIKQDASPLSLNRTSDICRQMSFFMKVSDTID